MLLYIFISHGDQSVLLQQSSSDKGNTSHSVTWFAICSNWLLSLGLCSVKSALSCQIPTVPSVFPTAKRWGFRELKAKQVAARPAPPWSIVAAGFSDLRPRSKICTSPEKEISESGSYILHLYGNLGSTGRKDEIMACISKIQQNMIWVHV